MNNTGASMEAIQSHYDLSNDFYHLWLDKLTKAYSSALYEQSDTLESAQLKKIDYHINEANIDRLNVAPTKSVLDIGCGWGGTLKRLRSHYQVNRLVGLTLSKAQSEFVKQLNIANTEVRLESWEDHSAKEKYGAIISIGAFEHFANLDRTIDEKIAGYRQFFSKCHGWLSSGGQLSLQTIVYENSTRSDFSDFFANEIFQESDLPRINEICEAVDGLFEIRKLRNDRKHYYLTQKAWWQNLKRNKSTIIELYGENVYSRYNKYLQLCMVGFKTGTMGLVRMTFKKISNPAPSFVKKYSMR